MMEVGATIHMTEENLHKLIITAGEVAYDRCKKGQSWEATRIELIDGLVAVTEPLTEELRQEMGLVRIGMHAFRKWER